MAPIGQCGKCPISGRSAFSCLTPAQRARFDDIFAVPHTYFRGETIFYEGNPSLAVYCIRSGQVKLTRHLVHDETVVGIYTAGDLIGYRAVLADLPYGISATVMESAVVCTIPRENFLALVQESHPFAQFLLKRMAREYRSAEAQLVERNGARVAVRTARLLVRLSRSTAAGANTGGPTPIRMRRADLADLLGTTPETLSRTLHSFARLGLLDVSRAEIGVRDLDRLARLAK